MTMQTNSLSPKKIKIIFLPMLIIFLLFLEIVTVKKILGVYYKKNAPEITQNIDKYKNLLEKSISLDPLYGAAKLSLSNIYITIGDFYKAEEQIFKALEVYNIGCGGYKQLGSIYLKTSQINKARENFEKALILFPDKPEILEYLSLIDIMEKEYKKALPKLEKATKEDPLRPNSYYMMGQIFEKHFKNIPLAIDYYIRALDSSLKFKEGLFFSQSDLNSRINILIQNLK